MKHNPTKAENAFMERLSELGIPFKPQVILGFYIADIILHEKMICIEIDGKSHDTKQKYDGQRDYFLEKLGFYVIHIKNEEVMDFNMQTLLLMPDVHIRHFRHACSKANVERGRQIVKLRKLGLWEKSKKTQKKANKRHEKLSTVHSSLF